MSSTAGRYDERGCESEGGQAAKIGGVFLSGSVEVLEGGIGGCSGWQGEEGW